MSSNSSLDSVDRFSLVASDNVNMQNQVASDSTNVQGQVRPNQIDQLCTAMQQTLRTALTSQPSANPIVK